MKIELKTSNFKPDDDLKSLGLSDEALLVLNNRGLKTKKEISEFLNFKKEDLRSVWSMLDTLSFVDKLVDAIKTDKVITIYGDYDGDGVMATTIWYTALAELGLKSRLHWFVNDRFQEGYGMNIKGVDRLFSLYPDTNLIITCDNGIKAVDGVKRAKELGMKVIISDHHTQSEGEDLPDCPVVCEKRLDESAYGDWCCGAELSRRLVEALYEKLSLSEEKRDFLQRLYAYSGFATVTDSITMNGANRFVVKEGLRQIKSEKDYCWQALRETLASTTSASAIDEETIGFQWGPMVNATGRVNGNVDTAMKVFLSSYWCGKEKNPQIKEAYKHACMNSVLELLKINQERQTLTASGNKLATTIIKERGYSDDKFIVLDDENFHEGINGLISSKVTETYHVPSLVLCPTATDPNIYKGSARSVEGFNLFEALEKCKDVMLGFGGHPGAAGVSIKKENIPLLRERLKEIAQVVPKPDDTIYVDFLLDPKPTENINAKLKGIGPFGEGFEKPKFGFDGQIESVMLLRDRKTGIEKHVKCNVYNDTCNVVVLWWNSVQQFNEQIRQLGTMPHFITCSCSAPKYWPSAKAKGGIEVKLTADVVDLA